MKTFIGERLKSFLIEKKISQTELGKRLGGKTRGTVNHWCTGSQPIPREIVIQILNLFPEMGARWFITGEGPMFEAGYTNKNGKLYTSDDVEPIQNPLYANPQCKEEIQRMMQLIQELTATNLKLVELLHGQSQKAEGHGLIVGGVGSEVKNEAEKITISNPQDLA